MARKVSGNERFRVFQHDTGKATCLKKRSRWSTIVHTGNSGYVGKVSCKEADNPTKVPTFIP